jgi:hypothetical protein
MYILPRQKDRQILHREGMIGRSAGIGMMDQGMQILPCRVSGFSKPCDPQEAPVAEVQFPRMSMPKMRRLWNRQQLENVPALRGLHGLLFQFTVPPLKFGRPVFHDFFQVARGRKRCRPSD